MLVASLDGSQSQDLVETVRGAGDIVRLISDYVSLKQRGSRLLGLCPFHQEKTPSFSVDPNLQLFYCFGCHTGGDTFKFVMLYEKVDFREAVELLARRWGVSLPSASPGDTARRRLIEMNDAAASFFRVQLADPAGGQRPRDYLAGRGMYEDVLTRLHVGYAPDGWEALRNHLVARRFNHEEIVSGGLAMSRREGRGIYDRFRHRLIFPIRDSSGRTIAFGGRALGNDEPKYLNSPETPVYTKGEHLYGLDSAREAIRREGLAVVVEGYMDLAAVLQAGVDAVVATLGTSFTPAQARLLARYTDRVVVSYDGDAAGATATARSLDLLLEKGFEVRVLDLPQGLDPDDFIRREGAEAYVTRLRQAPSYLEFLIQREVSSRDLGRIEERVSAAEALLPHLAKLTSAIERTAWAQRVADALRIDDDLVLQELRSAVREARPRLRQRPSQPERMRESEARLLSLVLASGADAAAAAADIVPEDLENTRVARILRTAQRLGEEDLEVTPGSVFAALEDEEDRDLLARVALSEDPGQSGEWREQLDACVQALRKDRLVRERRELQRQIECAPDPSAMDALLARKQELARRIDALS